MGNGVLVFAVGLFACSQVSAATTQVCDPDELAKAYSESWKLTSASSDQWDACSKQDFQNCPPEIDTKPIEENKIRFKLCADAGSAEGAFFYATWLLSHDLYELRRQAEKGPIDTSNIQDEKIRHRIQKVQTNVGTKAKAKVPIVARESLSYFEKSYALDNRQLGAAESIGDLLASGDVGEGRRFEALDWYYKAGSGYLKLTGDTSNIRALAVGVFEKMAKIDRENPLTKKLEAQIYK
jgi:hypothetical protein